MKYMKKKLLVTAILAGVALSSLSHPSFAVTCPTDTKDLSQWGAFFMDKSLINRNDFRQAFVESHTVVGLMYYCKYGSDRISEKNTMPYLKAYLSIDDILPNPHPSWQKSDIHWDQLHFIWQCTSPANPKICAAVH